ncbi:hypothetical protein VitviT2T_008753 [Vitis vinifera]|uniref:Ubiquitin-like protease family profile domain-containing protein n=1 Tax=Vitis vinifera TaxID=29760 RepID=A0ABY9C5V5_VITVI|nr:hypothetical protein VitviT2T_008753 [Vitis vinifera]
MFIFAATKDSLSRHFNEFGEVVKVIRVTDAATRQPKGSDYVEFMRKEAAGHALSLDGTSFMSRILKVVDAFCRMLQFDDESRTKLFLSPYIADMVIRSNAKHLTQDAIVARFDPYMYAFDGSYQNVTQVYSPVLFKNHWTLYVYDLHNKRIQLLDSRPGRKRSCMSGIQQKLAKVVLLLVADKKEMVAVDLNMYSFVMPDVPCQPNDNDCGVFIMKFMDNWSNGGLSKSIDVSCSSAVKSPKNGRRRRCPPTPQTPISAVIPPLLAAGTFQFNNTPATSSHGCASSVISAESIG